MLLCCTENELYSDNSGQVSKFQPSVNFVSLIVDCTVNIGSSISLVFMVRSRLFVEFFFYFSRFSIHLKKLGTF